MGTSSSADVGDGPGRARWRWALAGFAVLEVTLIVAAVAWVAIYSHLLAPGRDLAAYQAYAQVASPIVSVVAGIPAFWGAGRILRRRLGGDARRTALVMAGIWVAVDALLLLTFAENQGYNWAMAILSNVSKVGALTLAVKRR
jgi:hypothetical protein